MMLTPATLLPPSEVERLSALRQLDILPAVQEPVFNEFVRLTTLLLNVPISLISFVEADEVFYKANEGLPGLLNQPRVEAICSQAIRENKAVVLVDVIQEASGLTSEALAAAQARNLQFYAGFPLAIPSKHCLGTLCVLDHQPRTFSPEDWLLLQEVSELVVHTLVIRHASRSAASHGERRWQIIQQVLTLEVAGIRQLVQHLNSEFAKPISASPLAAKRMKIRLNDLAMLLIDYHQRLSA